MSGSSATEYRIPEHLIDQVIDHSDIVSIIGRYVTLKKKGKDYFGLCPFHDEDTPSFSVSPTRQRYYCFGCRAGGTAITFLMKHLGLGFREALQELAQEAGIVIETSKSSGQAGEGREAPKRLSREERLRLESLLEEAAAFYHQQLRASTLPQKYLVERGFDGKTALRYRLGYSPADGEQSLKYLTEKGFRLEEMMAVGLVSNTHAGPRDRFAGRLMFPIWDQAGRMSGFSARLLESDSAADQPKYLNSSGSALFDKGTTLYGLMQAMPMIKERGRVIVVEGFLDALALAQNGFPETVACMGTALTDAQIRTLLRLAPEVLVCLDGDEAGLRASIRSVAKFAEALRDGDGVRFVFLPDEKDPDEAIRSLGKERFAQLLENAPRLSEIVLKESGIGVQDSDILEYRLRWVASAMDIIDRMSHAPLTRKTLIKELRRLSGIDPITKEVVDDSRESREKQLLKIFLRFPDLLDQTPPALLQECVSSWGQCAYYLACRRQTAKQVALSGKTLFKWVQGTEHEKTLRQCASTIDLSPATDMDRIVFIVIYGKIMLRFRREQLKKMEATEKSNNKMIEKELEFISSFLGD